MAEPRSLFAALDALDPAAAGAEMHALARRLHPICRSITGPGNRETLRLLRESIPLEIREIPSGTPVFDWTVPPEWTIRAAWIKGPDGRTVVDFADHNLHVVSYSAPVRRKMPLAELQKHLHSLPAQPDLIPYRTSYYSETWGFCLPHRLRETLPEGGYEVCVDSTLAPGSLSIGELVLPGESPDEVLVSTHICHPSLANDNLSGIAVAARLARILAGLPRRHTFRFVFLPGTIGSITWLAQNREAAARIRHGLVLSCVGDAAAPTYKKSRRGDAAIDRAMAEVLRHRAPGSRVVDFSPYGYDERQYGSPGFNLPAGLFMRSVFGTFPEYHTSADNLDFVKPEALASSLALVLEALAVIEGDGVFVNTAPMCEPQLGRRGLYEAIGGGNDRQTRQLALLWVLNQSDGANALLDIAVRAGLPFRLIREAADLLLRAGLLEARA
ncbi:MAG: DUF4910 domain-containing protein [Kiritimatiellia bacterium]